MRSSPLFALLASIMLLLAACRPVTEVPAPASSSAALAVPATPNAPAPRLATPAVASPVATPQVHTDAQCNPSSSQPWNGTANGLLEIQGTANSGQFWALIEGDGPLAANAGAKIIWKLSGDTSATLKLAASDTQGNRLAPLWGPNLHLGSNWQRPGAEWGAGFEFPHPGCWEITASSGTSSGHLWFAVAAPSGKLDPGPPLATPLYPVPASCHVTPLSPAEAGRGGFVAHRAGGAGLTMAIPTDYLFQQLSNDVHWELDRREPLTVTGLNLDHPDQTASVNDLSGSLSDVYPSTIEFAEAGCWQLHAEAGQQTLDVTVYVYPAGCLPPNWQHPPAKAGCEPPQ